MAKAGAPEKLIVNGKRLDGRGLGEFRPIEAEAGVIPQSQGSARFSFGETKALAGVQGPRPMHPKGLQEPTRTILRCHYFMAPFATSERGRPGRSRRSTEISKVIAEALSNVIFLEDYPKTALDIFMEIMQANASTRCAALNAASMALADAGVPMRDIVSSLSVGKVDGQLILDVMGAEDNFGDVDMAVATVGGGDAFVLLQMDGVITLEEFRAMLEMARDGCAVVYQRQKEALMKRYSAEEVSE
ncbi:MAG: exosome complex exonuclease Rrp41 [Candidatus Aenigmatarchaeota archaeon]